MLAAGFKLPKKNIVISIGPMQSKRDFVPCAQTLVEMGYTLFATKGTYDILKETIESVSLVNKPQDKNDPKVTTMMVQGKIDMMINVPTSMDSKGATNGFEMRRQAVDAGVSLLVDLKTATMMVQSLHRKYLREKAGRVFWGITSWQEYQEHQRSAA